MPNVTKSLSANVKNKTFFRSNKLILLVTAALKKESCDVKVEKNIISSSFIPTKVANVYYDSTAGELKIFPRVGAFEVRIFGKLVFSKLRTGLWPYFPYVVSVIKELICAYNNDEDLDYVFGRITKAFEKQNNDVNPATNVFTSRSFKRTITPEPGRKNNVPINRSRKLEPIKHDFDNFKRRSKTMTPTNLPTLRPGQRTINSKNRSISPIEQRSSQTNKFLTGSAIREPQRPAAQISGMKKTQEVNHKFRVNKYTTNQGNNTQPVNTDANLETNTSMLTEGMSIQSTATANVTQVPNDASIIQEIALQEIEKLTNATLQLAINEISKRELSLNLMLQDYDKRRISAELNQCPKAQVVESSAQDLSTTKPDDLDNLKMKSDFSAIVESKTKTEFINISIPAAENQTESNKSHQNGSRILAGSFLGISSLNDGNSKLSPKVKQIQENMNQQQKANGDCPEQSDSRIVLDYSEFLASNNVVRKKVPDLEGPSLKKSHDDITVADEETSKLLQAENSQLTNALQHINQHADSKDSAKKDESSVLKQDNQGGAVIQTSFAAKLINVLADNDLKGARPQFRKEKYTPSKKAETSLSEG